MDHGAPSQYYPDQPLPVAYGIPSGLPSAKSEEDRLREEIAQLKSENAELRGKDAPKGKGTHSRRPKKAEGAKKPRGAPTSEYHGVSAAPSKKNPWQARATNPVSLGGDGKYKSIGLFPTEKEAAMAVDDYLYKTFPEKYAAFRANFPRNADGTCDVSGVPGPPPGGPPL